MALHDLRTKIAIALALLLALTAAGGYAALRLPSLFGARHAGPAPIDVSGNIEAHESMLSVTQVQAPIVYLPFDEGARVARGTVLARVDDRLYRRQVDIDQANLDVQLAQVDASRSNLVAVEHSVVSDRFDLSEKRLDASRADVLAAHQAVSQQSSDLARTAERQSAATLAHDVALVAAARNNVALALANVEAARARLRQDETMLSYTELRAPFDGVIAVREAELGQLAGPGVAIMTLDELDHVWLRAYVNEPDIGRIRLGEAVDVRTDAYPSKVYRGRISFVSPQAEFTPKTVETHAERVTLVYRIRIDIDNPTHELLPGMPADASMTPLASGR
ncbi:HlyD family secretion protein [Paraburkholderia caballeronis]|uniref:HlyD family secretion protein n=1 Tax=Paraburkholderia caballeronis TaxID=416943 RepID=A0A1H7P8E7_9BURK|nr:efflux RND transporter periplasmic adaptor subunit [Paraburkholderia caballeronis]PXW25347.1 HlyD family secretion protein [Paraburkholderia caballeronis]PXX00954.1 HlyD family secretion protein [Paraburkholderia caballeronis]RAJ99693.1 HlyD family secretion protein [Paraburkholderia caballeronis]TDV03072.1 HlyD family secretion protein [Paraburkholderia caballeronis]TDV08394.1 HlyD family secretion protein [Paraburkholderia caballeronis]